MPSRSNHLPGFSQQMQKPQQAKNLKNHIGQLANELISRTQGALPSNTINLRNTSKEPCEAITLRKVAPVNPTKNKAQQHHREGLTLIENTKKSAPQKVIQTRLKIHHLLIHRDSRSINKRYNLKNF
ncbi:hypothetical protein EPI10_031597 [Gossypium australe]|uniref:Uncharacterized protein n=1 Tax=Gossypium australe TaxID=47621 RepID=A0A5B6X3U6_9ROSI|nr:hypothetical protein EPI10_031597 [Gossypium australe]